MLLVLAMLLAHGLLSIACQGGWRQIESPWPPSWHDHPMHYHNAVVTRAFLSQNGTTAGYDPYFMAGYAKSIISDPSGTLIEVFVAIFGRDDPARAYKQFILLAMAVLPWLVAASIVLFGGGSEAMVGGVLAFLVYLWTDFPLEYAGFGMLTFLLVVPAGTVVLPLVSRYLGRGGAGRWLLAAVGSAVLILIHPLAALTVGPAAIVTYVAAIGRARRSGPRMPPGRHLGVWTIPVVILLANAFWWLPAVVLWTTKQSRGLGFFHPEPVADRIGQIFGLAEPSQGPIQAVLLAGAGVGLAVLRRSDRLGSTALGVFIAIGFFWGYLAGAFRSLDFLEPGRNTYAVYTGASVATGLGWASVRRRLATDPGRLDRWLVLGLLIVGTRLFAPSMLEAIRLRTGRAPILSVSRGRGGSPRIQFFPETARLPYLSSQPPEALVWLVDQVRARFEPGDRIYYEEGGRSTDDLPDIFEGRRFGGLLPSMTGVEVIGGPFLHVPIQANFTQFGMGRLFGNADWDRDDFDRYARLYRPSGLVCWSPKAVAFCRNNPDRVQIVAEREPFVIGRILGFEGDAIRGEAKVIAGAGRLEVREGTADVDGLIVLRYHSVSGLRCRPPVPLQAVELPGDPVPFIGLRPPDGFGSLRIEWDRPP